MHDSPADPPDQSHDSDGLQRVVGGAELSIKFAHADDRERVVHAGRTMGWSPEDDVEDLWMDDGLFVCLLFCITGRHNTP